MRTTWILLACCLASTGCPSGEVDGDDPPDNPDDDDTTDDELPPSFPVTVRVTRDGAPLPDVSVLQGGGQIQGTTDADGTFVATIDSTVEGELWVIASLRDHRSQAERIREADGETVELELKTVEVDNPDYTYATPGGEQHKTTEYCSHCHFRFAEQFAGSAHRGAASNPEVHDLYAGTASAFGGAEACEAAGGRWASGTLPGGGAGERCYVAAGFLPDSLPGCGDADQPPCDADPAGLPGGRCADCHAPAVNGPAGGGWSLLNVEGIAFDEGVHCDFCHKVRDVDMDAAPGVAGRLVLGRPQEPDGGASEFVPVMYGPYFDVPNVYMGGSPAPHFRDATICGGCHQYEQEGLWEAAAAAIDADRWPSGTLPIHSTIAEWNASPSWSGVGCQYCHMPAMDVPNSADLDLFEGTSPGVAGGFERPYGEVRDHSFYGPLNVLPADGMRLIETAAALTPEVAWIAAADSASGAAELTVDSRVTNVGAGHALPTGEPLRSVVLVVHATCQDEPLTLLQGPTITEVGGRFADGVVGDGVESGDRGAGPGSALDWEGVDALVGEAPEDLVVRAVRPTGGWVDYDGIGPFGDGTFDAAAKGLPEVTAVGEAAVVAIDGTGLELATPLDLLPGDRVYVVEPSGGLQDGAPARALAGAPGVDFARVLVGLDGRRGAPHYGAVDVARDNRIASGAGAEQIHRFALPEGCDEASVSASLLYRRAPLSLARERGWTNVEVMAAAWETTVTPD